VPKIELKLFGSPSLFLDGIDVTPDRPVGFEILAKVIVAGVDGVSRASLSTLLWPDIPTTKARTNLRVNLANLRAELSQIGITDSFELDDAVLRTKGVIGVDLRRFLARPIRSVSELEAAILPLCQGWDRERWQEENEAVASHLAEGFCRIRQTSPKVDTLHLLRTAVKSHLVSTQLTTLYVDALTGQNRVDEATQAVIDFENAWISRFGVADLPNISLDAVAQPIAMESRHKAMTYAVPLCCLLVAVVAVGYTLNRPGGKEKSPKLAVTDVKRESGFEIKKIFTEGAEPREISPLLGFSGQPMLHYRNQIFEVQQPGQISPIRDTQWIPVDTNGNSKLEVSPDASLLRISTASSRDNIRPVADYPYFDAPMIVEDGSVVYNRRCGHSFRDHRKLCYWKNGTETLIHISTPEPQNAVVTCKTARGILGSTAWEKVTVGSITPSTLISSLRKLRCLTPRPLLPSWANRF
jgi:hypothetical protein